MRLTTTYAPGKHHAIMWSGGAMLIAGDLAISTLARLHASLQEVTTLRAALEALSEVCEQSLFDVPDFAAVVVAEADVLHVASRGQVPLIGVAEDDEFCVDGHGATIWSERRVEAASSLILAEAFDEGLPLADGVVAAGGLSITLEDSLSAFDNDDEVEETDWLPMTSLRLLNSASSYQFDEMSYDDLSYTAEAASPVVIESANEPQPPQVAPRTEREYVEESAAEQTMISDIPVVSGRRFSAELAAELSDTATSIRQERAQRMVPMRSASVDRSGYLASHHSTALPAYDDCSLDPFAVVAVHCPNDHANPPQSARCWICALPTDGQPRQVSRPSLGTLLVSTGAQVELTKSVIVGRDPRVRSFAGELPTVLKVPFSHVTANHLEIRVDGWNLYAIDLNSRNGTYLRRPGQAPMRVPAEPLELRSGDTLDLGQGLTIALGNLPL